MAKVKTHCYAVPPRQTLLGLIHMFHRDADLPKLKAVIDGMAEDAVRKELDQMRKRRTTRPGYPLERE